MACVLMDSRERPEATGRIIDYFQQNRIPYDRTKLYFGDYMEYGNPHLVIDRKQTLNELATNCATAKDRERFKRELEKVKSTGSKLILLVEQKTYTDRGEKRTINSLEDIVLWQSKYSKITGEQMYRTLTAWCRCYPLEIEFCDKRSTGRRICEILGVKSDGSKRG